MQAHPLPSTYHPSPGLWNWISQSSHRSSERQWLLAKKLVWTPPPPAAPEKAPFSEFRWLVSDIKMSQQRLITWYDLNVLTNFTEHLLRVPSTAHVSPALIPCILSGECPQCPVYT